MTTKYRIIAGFVLMMVLLAGIGMVAVSGLGTASRNFDNYDRLAHLVVNMSNTASEMRNASAAVERFFIERKEEFITQALASLDTSSELLKKSIDLMHVEEHQVAGKRALEGLEQYKELVKRSRDEVFRCLEEFDSRFQPTMDEMVEQMRAVNKNATQTQNVGALMSLNNVWDSFSLARRNVAAYMLSLNPQNAQLAEDSLKEMAASIRGMTQYMTSPLAQTDYEVITKANEVLALSLNALIKVGRETSSILDQTQAIDQQVMDLVAVNTKSVNAEMEASSRETFAANGKMQTATIAISVIGVVLAILIASLISIGFIRVLRNMSGYAEAIAGGDFAYDPKIREKGEFKTMLDAMRRIPDILEDMVGHCNELSCRISGGSFRSRLDETTGAGRYRDLLASVNRIAQAFTNVIDALPVGVMTADTERRIRYLNRNLQGVLKGEHAGETCGSCFNTAACPNLETCLGARTMTSGSEVSGEVQISPNGKRMELAVAASPLRDEKGEVVGFMEAISDVTQMRITEETMRNVAEEAARISSTVASASEQLNVQVAQVTQGAETQRLRVETTSSAVTEMSVTVGEVARSAAQAAEQSDLTREKAESGARLVGEVVTSINQVNAAAGKLQENMNRLGTQAESISEVLTVITDIADQTNLLALNAAIEAARAGDAGRGFAVVADEVRKLAEKTMQATHEVGERITSMQEATTSNIRELESAVEEVREVADIAGSSGAALKEILELATGTSALVASIAAASEQQNSTSEEISAAISDINEIVGKTAEGMVQSSQAVQELSGMAQNLRRVMERLES